jgi:hypothetical protein
LAEAARAMPALIDQVILYIGHALLAGLATAHEACDAETGEPAPVVHRNVHPGSVRLAWTGDVKLTGFATAKRLVGGDATYPPGRLRGTYGYMAPEQALGEKESVRTDIYSAALVLYEMLAHRRVFHVDGMPELELLKAMAYPSLPSLASLRPDLHPSLCKVIDLALAADPGARRASASAMATVLGSMIGLRAARQACAEALAPMRADPSWHATPKAPSALASSDLPSEPDRTERFHFDEVLVPRSVRPSTLSLHPLPEAPAGVARPRAARVRRWVALAAAAVAMAAVALLAPWWIAVRHRAPKTAERTAPRPASAAHGGPSAAIGRPPPVSPVTAPPVAPSALPAASPPVVQVPAVPPPSPTRGTLLTPPRAVTHRIYVDGRVIGEGHRSFEVRCGVRLVRVGSAGRDQRVVVPCGGSIAVP